MAEWTSDRSYKARVANLRGAGAGPRANGDLFLKAAGPHATVFNDGDRDKLTGTSGQHWFFAGELDKITDLRARELVESLV